MWRVILVFISKKETQRICIGSRNAGSLKPNHVTLRMGTLLSNHFRFFLDFYTLINFINIVVDYQNCKRDDILRPSVS